MHSNMYRLCTPHHAHAPYWQTLWLESRKATQFLVRDAGDTHAAAVSAGAGDAAAGADMSAVNDVSAVIDVSAVVQTAAFVVAEASTAETS